MSGDNEFEQLRAEYRALVDDLARSLDLDAGVNAALTQSPAASLGSAQQDTKEEK